MTSYAHIRESAVRSALPVGSAFGDFTIVELGRFSAGGEGIYPSILAVLAHGDEHSVHDIVAKCSSGGISAPSIVGFGIISGQYGFTLNQAMHYLDQR